MILQTAKQHFDEDVQRAKDIHRHATGVADGRLKDDLLRSAWMVGVGASDAFFCDAYADLVSRTLRAKEKQSSVQLQDRLSGLKVPVIAILNSKNGWRWRMAAREMIEKESVLSIQQIKDFLNIFCRDQHKLLRQETVEGWILHTDARQRHFGLTKAHYRAVANDAKSKTKKNALENFGRRMQSIFQRRHDCIHNCDRPRSAIQPIKTDITQKALYDVTFRLLDELSGWVDQVFLGGRFSA